MPLILLNLYILLTFGRHPQRLKELKTSENGERLLAAFGQLVFQAYSFEQEHNSALEDEQEPIYGHDESAMIDRFALQAIVNPILLWSCLQTLS